MTTSESGIVTAHGIFNNISNEKDAKAKLKKLADSMGQEIEQIEYQLIYRFIKQKTQIIRLF